MGYSMTNFFLQCHLPLMHRGKKVYEPPKFMTINTAIEQLLEVEASRAESGNVLNSSPLYMFRSLM